MDIAHEPVLNGTIGHRQQRIVIAVHIEQSASFPLQAELRPGEHLAKLLPGSEAAWKCDKAVGQVSHQGLSLMHGGDDAQLGEPLMADLFVNQGLWNDSDHSSAMP